MQNKKIIISVVVFFIVVFGLVYFFMIDKKMTENNQKGMGCEFSSDQEAHQKAIGIRDAKMCACIKDEQLKNTCLDAVKETDIYKKATDKMDIGMCQNIEDETSRESCILAVKDRMAYIETVKKDNNSQKSAFTIVDYEKIRQENPEDVENLINLAIAYSFNGSNNKANQNNFSDNTSVEIGQIDKNNIKKILDILAEAKQLAPSNSRVYSAEGYVYSLNLQNNMAMDAYEKSLKLDPNNIDALLGRASVYSYLKKNNEAIADFEKVLKIDESEMYGDSIINIALCGLYANINREKAMQSCNAVINGNGDETMKTQAKNILESL